MKKEKKLSCLTVVLVVVIIVGLGVGVRLLLVKNPITAEKGKVEEKVPVVHCIEVEVGEYRVEMGAQGQVEPITQTTIVSEVAGAVEFISPKLERGGSFEVGEVMLRVAQLDYQAQVEQTRASVADAELSLVQEEARAEQSLRDWEKLGKKGEPSVLVKRVPQLKSARARLIAAQALAQQAEGNLMKTEIQAPYSCVVADSFVKEGGYVTGGGRVAEIYTADKLKVRLPLRLDDFAYLPEKVVGLAVTVFSHIGKEEKVWQGAIVRTEGAVDRATHTMMVVVELKRNQGEPLPPVGLFVKGEIRGALISNAVRLPRKALRQDSTVWLVDGNGKLAVRTVEVERRTRDEVVVSEGLKIGEKVIVTPIAFPVEGMKLRVVAKDKGESSWKE